MSNCLYSTYQRKVSTRWTQLLNTDNNNQSDSVSSVRLLFGTNSSPEEGLLLKALSVSLPT